MKTITITLEASNEDELLEELMQTLAIAQSDFVMYISDNDLKEMKLVTTSLSNPSDSFTTENLAYLIGDDISFEEIEWLVDFDTALASHLEASSSLQK